MAAVLISNHLKDGDEEEGVLPALKRGDRDGWQMRMFKKVIIIVTNNFAVKISHIFQFYRNFALPYFYTKKESEPFSLAYNICEKSAYKLLMKLIKVENNSAYNNVFQELKNNSILKKSISRSLLFSIFPYNIANYVNQKIN